MKTRIVTLESLPQNADELRSYHEYMKTPEGTAILTLAALCRYPASKEDACAMLDVLRGPRPLSEMERQFIRDRFMDGKDYIPRSYFKGASVENDYVPLQPYELSCMDDEREEEEGYKTLYLSSSGADSPRPIKLRNKPSTGEWFLWEQSLLAGIREPASKDPWR